MRDNIGTSSWLDQVKRAPAKGRSMRLQESMKLEDSFIVQDKQPHVNLSKGNIMSNDIKKPTQTPRDVQEIKKTTQIKHTANNHY